MDLNNREYSPRLSSCLECSCLSSNLQCVLKDRDNSSCLLVEFYVLVLTNENTGTLNAEYIHTNISYHQLPTVEHLGNCKCMQ